jgi:hypothetical protein
MALLFFFFTAREASQLATVLENFTLGKNDDDYDFSIDFKET